jgi:hypothetical protein
MLAVLRAAVLACHTKRILRLAATGLYVELTVCTISDLLTSMKLLDICVIVIACLCNSPL